MDYTDGSTESLELVCHNSGRGLRPWLISLALASPVLLLYLSHFACPPAGMPTGFIQGDMPYYLANAREHFDTGRFRFFFSNPYELRYDAPAIYVQPMSLILGVIMHTTHVPPGLLFVAFEFLAAWVCARVALALYAEIVGLGGWARGLGLVAFFWGGGLLALSGIGYVLATRGVSGFGSPGLLDAIFRFDPKGGWWFLNFGRNLIFPTEAMYHAIFFGCILFLLRGRFVAATVLALLLSASHPFTGVELLLILASWAALELYFVRSDAVPRGFFIALVGLLALHVGYYLVYLGRFSEHRRLMKAWTLAWELDAVNFVPADALVGLLAFWSFRRLDLARSFFAQPRNRLFLTWFLVAFALANHEFAIRPIQPLHFTRGYIWTPLFFMGATTLVDLFVRLRRQRRPMLGTLAVGVVLATLLLDNALWLGQFPLRAWLGYSVPGYGLTANQLDLYRWLSRDENRGALMLTDDGDLGYLASVYTPLRSWLGHGYNTPDISTREEEMKAFFEQGQLVDAWRGMTLLVVVDHKAAQFKTPPESWARPVYENEGYHVFRLEPPRSELSE